MGLRRTIKEYFSFTRGERLGVIGLVVVIIVVIGIKQSVFYFEKPTVADRLQFEQLLAEQRAAKKAVLKEKRMLFEFNPNTIDSITLSTLDLPLFVKKNLLRYREHGGRFKKTSDFRKLYGMNDSIFALVEAYLLISPPSALISQTDLKAAAINPRTTIRSGMRVETPSAGRPVSINLNKSTAEELEKLKGIGPVLSKRIVKYRDLLGGYVSAMQLTEVYGLKPEVVEMNRSFVFADTLDIRKMDLNFLSVDELAAHPYINYKEARRIVDFRSKNGYISDKNILLSDSVIGEEHFRKLSSYLK